MIHEAFGLHLGGISLILPTPECYCNYSREGIERVSSYCQLLSLHILLFPSFVNWERRSLTLGKGSVQDNEQDLKGGHLEGLACDSVESGLGDYSVSFSTLFSVISGYMAIQRFEMTRNLTSRQVPFYCNFSSFLPFFFFFNKYSLITYIRRYYSRHWRYLIHDLIDLIF